MLSWKFDSWDVPEGQSVVWLSQNSKVCNMIKDPMVAMDAPKESFIIAIKEPLYAKGDLYDCNQGAPIVSLLVQ